MPSSDLLRVSARPSARSLPEAAWILAVAAAVPVALWLGRAPDPASHAVMLAAQPAAAAPATAVAGWFATYSGPRSGSAAVREVKTHAASAAFALEPDESLDPSLPAAGVVARYEAQVRIETAGRYRFGVEAAGGAAGITVFDSGGKSLAQKTADRAASPVGEPATTTDWINLPAGNVTLIVRFTRAGTAPARFRAMWQLEPRGPIGPGRMDGFRMEPIPTSAARVPRHALDETASGLAALRGRVLLGEMSCIECHDTGDDHAEPGAAHEGHEEHAHHESASVLHRHGPLLGEIGRRASPEWLRAWITDPQKIKPGSGMPDVLGDSPKDLADADAILHFLVSMGGPSEPQPVATEANTLAYGRALYHSVGCVTCHGAFDSPLRALNEAGLPDAKPAEPPVAPLGRIGGKWRAQALAEFLQDPLRTHDAGRMPSLNLSTQDAELIATYLINTLTTGPGDAPVKPNAPEPAFKVDAQKVEIGKAVFAARGCSSCHEIGHGKPDIAKKVKGPAIKAIAAKGAAGARSGCLNPADTKTPRYTLSAEQRADIAAGIVWASQSIGTHAPIDESQRLVAAMNCLVCHAKDELGGPSDTLKPYFRNSAEVELGDEGRMPPSLTGVGSKLTTPWLRQVLVNGGRARPYMSTRMPQYGEENIEPLIAGLAAMDGVAPNTDRAEPASTDAMTLAGKTLVGENGLNCISCHVFGRAAPAGTPGPNISDFAERLRYDWWTGYIHAPQRVKPGTRMPTFFAGGRGTVTTVLDGNPERQGDAMWAYFALGSLFMPEPEGVPSEQGVALDTSSAPVVFRSFMRDTGARGIAVGYPAGIHFGFDATRVRLVDAWEGDFVDASGAWRGRGGMVSGGQGRLVWTAPAGPPVVITAGAAPAVWPDADGADAGYRFQGYTLDAAGVPTFRYTVGEALVEERFEPVRTAADGPRTIRRTFSITGLGAGRAAFINAGRGAVTVSGGGEVVPQADGSTWIRLAAPSDPAQPARATLEITP